MLSERVQYQTKAGFNFKKWYFLKYWQVRTSQIFAQTVTQFPMLALTNMPGNL